MGTYWYRTYIDKSDRSRGSMIGHVNHSCKTLNGNSIVNEAQNISNNADAVLAKFGWSEAVLA
jgi:hypothetical protein